MSTLTSRDVEDDSQPSDTTEGDSSVITDYLTSGSNLDRGEAIQRLRALVLRELDHFSRSSNGVNLTKEDIRHKHSANRIEILKRDRTWIAKKAEKLINWFACGSDIVPPKVCPHLVPVETREQQDLFRLARYTWSLPYSKGYGRRLKFLILDCSNGKLMGVLGLQSPPLDLSPRDLRFTFASGRKVELVNQTMDIYVQGAVPPYNALLGGKLVVMAAAASEVRQAYRDRYEGRLTRMEGRQLPANLVAVTTTSAFGRSSLYNRVFFEKEGRRYKVAESLGLLRGYGVFHFTEATYQILKDLIRKELPGRKVSGFSSGPRVKWQVITLALNRLGIPSSTMRHGIRREAYLIRLVDNLEAYFSGAESVPKYRQWAFSELATFWKHFYLLGPRRQRPDHWRKWHREQVIDLVIPNTESIASS